MVCFYGFTKFRLGLSAAASCPRCRHLRNGFLHSSIDHHARKNSAANFLYSAFKGLRTQCEVYSRSPSPVAVPHRSQPLWELAAETSDVIVSVDLPHSLARPPGPHVGHLQPRNHFRPQHLHLPPKPCNSGFMKEHRSEPSWNQVPAWPVRWIRRCAPCGTRSEPGWNQASALPLWGIRK